MQTNETYDRVLSQIDSQERNGVPFGKQMIQISQEATDAAAAPAAEPAGAETTTTDAPAASTEGEAPSAESTSPEPAAADTTTT